ncbi:MAG: hypothetical protein IJE78_06010 [Bacteroidaceae bacterium]|nr:hypothetical protein [Bacteroidaceae bacterium]
MIRIENLEVFNLEGAIRGMRNAKNSWHLSDSEYQVFSDEYGRLTKEEFVIGPKDMKLAHDLEVGGPPHRKYLRQIFVSMDIIAPRYFWTQFDTYKVGTTKNSCSTMHKIHAKDILIQDFSHEHVDSEQTLLTYKGIKFSTGDVYNLAVLALNELKNKFNETKDKKYWYQIIQLLPQGYNQRATVTLDYENIVDMLQWRSEHKLDEWRDFCHIMMQKLPYIKEIIEGDFADETR